MNNDFTIKKVTYAESNVANVESDPTKAYLYLIHFTDESLKLLNILLSYLSTFILQKRPYLIKRIIDFSDSDDKLLYATNILNGVWNDHPYPDESIIVWANVDSTKHNLGLVTTLIMANESCPSVLYSFTYDKIAIVNFNTREEGSIPSIYQMELDDLTEILKWWQDYVEKIASSEDSNNAL